MSGHIFGFITGHAVTPNDGEENGWIDLSWSRTVLHFSRNDVRPVVDCDERDDDLAEYVRDALGTFGPYFDNGDGTFYWQDETLSRDGWVWTYAIHVKRKFFGPNGWTEVDWHPVKNGGIEL